MGFKRCADVALGDTGYGGFGNAGKWLNLILEAFPSAMLL